MLALGAMDEAPCGGACRAGVDFPRHGGWTSMLDIFSPPPLPPLPPFSFLSHLIPWSGSGLPPFPALLPSLRWHVLTSSALWSAGALLAAGLCCVLGKKQYVAVAPTPRGLSVALGKVSSRGCWRRSQLLSNTYFFPTLDVRLSPCFGYLIFSRCKVSGTEVWKWREASAGSWGWFCCATKSGDRERAEDLPKGWRQLRRTREVGEIKNSNAEREK